MHVDLFFVSLCLGSNSWPQIKTEFVVTLFCKLKKTTHMRKVDSGDWDVQHIILNKSHASNGFFSYHLCAPISLLVDTDKNVFTLTQDSQMMYKGCRTCLNDVKLGQTLFDCLKMTSKMMHHFCSWLQPQLSKDVGRGSSLRPVTLICSLLDSVVVAVGESWSLGLNLFVWAWNSF